MALLDPTAVLASTQARNVIVALIDALERGRGPVRADRARLGSAAAPSRRRICASSSRHVPARIWT